MERLRGPFQGVTNIIRFNWHFYLLAVAILVILILLFPHTGGLMHVAFLLLIAGITITTLTSLIISWYIYDASQLYQLNWLDNFGLSSATHLINIHAGFDETSALLQAKFPHATLNVLDFYNPAKHTEVSIKRARKAYPPFPGTQSVSTTTLPVSAASAEAVFVILSAHEIRDAAERTAFFLELKRGIKPFGKIIVTEHLRNVPNFLAYTIGFFHFLSRNTWLRTFKAAGLTIVAEQKITPFITTFVLQQHGNTA